MRKCTLKYTDPNFIRLAKQLCYKKHSVVASINTLKVWELVWMLWLERMQTQTQWQSKIHISYCVHIESIERFECLVNLTIMTVAYKTKISCFCHRNVLCNAATIRWESKVLSTYTNFFFSIQRHTQVPHCTQIFTHTDTVQNVSDCKRISVDIP